MKNILVLPNPHKPEALQLTKQLLEIAGKQGLALVFENAVAMELDRPELGRDVAELWDGIDLVLVLGGDGSMLNAARRIYPRQIPLLGINLGQLGFLTCIEGHHLEKALENLANENYHLEERLMLQAEVEHAVGSPIKTVALNDFVVAKNSIGRMVRLETWIDGEYFTTYPADGLIVATATGSTAYSLSAGGPILDPRLQAILITPICAHSLYARPVLLNSGAQLKVVLNANHNDLSLAADGQFSMALQAGEIVHFKQAEHTTRLVRFKDQGLFEVLKSRLKEGRI